MTENAHLRVWTNTQFSGHWPVGTAAVVVAENTFEAAAMLEHALKDAGLPQSIDPRQFVELPIERGKVEILRDGDY